MFTSHSVRSWCLLFQASSEVDNSFTLVGKTQAESHLCCLIMQTSWINRNSINEFRILSRSVPEKDCLLGAAVQWDLRKKTEEPSGAFIHAWGRVSILMLVSRVIEKDDLAPSRPDSDCQLQT